MGRRRCWGLARLARERCVRGGLFTAKPVAHRAVVKLGLMGSWAHGLVYRQRFLKPWAQIPANPQSWGSRHCHFELCGLRQAILRCMWVKTAFICLACLTGLLGKLKDGAKGRALGTIQPGVREGLGGMRPGFPPCPWARRVHRKKQPTGWPAVTHGNQMAFTAHPSSAGEAFSDLWVVLRIPFRLPGGQAYRHPQTHSSFGLFSMAPLGR